jgi:hypothetical protein
MFWTLDQTAQRKLEAKFVALNGHPQTATRKPTNSNRESKLLEIAITSRKHSTSTHSNREKAPRFFGPSRGGSFLSDPPAFRPRFRRRIHPAEFQIHPSPRHRNSNREPQRLELSATLTKQSIDPTSNREKTAFRIHSRTSPQTGRASKGTHSRSPRTHFECSRPRRKRESAPRNFVSGRKELDRLFS